MIQLHTLPTGQGGLTIGLFLPLLLACGNVYDFKAAPLERVSTVIEVTWRAEAGDERAWVEYSTGGGELLVAPETDAEPGYHRVLVIGHNASTAVDLRPITERDGERIEGDEVTVETGELPSGLGDFEVRVSEPEQSDDLYWMGMLLKASEVGYDGTLIIIDRAGRIVWYRELDENNSALQMERWLGSNDVLINLLNLFPPAGVLPESMVRIAMDGEIVEEISVGGAHHAFTQPEPGTIAYLETDKKTFDEYGDTLLIGDKIMEIDASGSKTEIFSTWEALDIPVEKYASSGEESYDWTHANGIFYRADSDSYLISLHNLSVVIEVSRSTGEVLAMIGADEEDFTFPGGEEARFYQQHHPTFTSEGTLMLFDNHTIEQGMSRAVEYALDFDQRTATLIWEDPLDNGYTVGGLGQSQRLPNGNTLINWGILGELTEVTAQRGLVWQVNTPLGETFGSGQLIDDLYEGLNLSRGQ